jgi:hypothetical protein
MEKLFLLNMSKSNKKILSLKAINLFANHRIQINHYRKLRKKPLGKKLWMSKEKDLRKDSAVDRII